MVTKKITITNTTGLHARPASELVALAKTFESKISLSNGTKTVNAMSPIHVLTLGAKSGTEIEVIAEGADETAAAEAIVIFLEQLKD